MFFVTRGQSLSSLGISCHLRTLGEALDRLPDLSPQLRTAVNRLVEDRGIVVPGSGLPADPQPEQPRFFPLSLLGSALASRLSGAGFPTLGQALRGPLPASLSALLDRRILDFCQEAIPELPLAGGDEAFRSWLQEAVQEPDPRSALCRLACTPGGEEPRPLWASNPVALALRLAILQQVERYPDGISLFTLHAALPPGLSGEHLEALLEDLDRGGWIRRFDDFVEPPYPTIRDLMQAIPDPQLCDVLRRHLEQDPPEDRRALPQWNEETAMLLQRLPLRELRLAEDRYRPLLERCHLTRERFARMFGETVETWRYERLVVSTRRVLLSAPSLRSDPAICCSVRLRAGEGGSASLLHLDGRWMPRRAMVLLAHVLSRRCLSPTPVEEIRLLYSRALEQLGLASDREMLLSPATLERRLQTCPFALEIPGHLYRYYPFARRDTSALLAQLALHTLPPQELSAQHLYEEHRDLMEEYDIRSGLELHNLLRRLCHGDPDSPLRFQRSPFLLIGNPDRTHQVLELMRCCPDGDLSGLDDLFRQTYGMPLPLDQKNLQVLSQCLEADAFWVASSPLSQEQLQKLRERFTGEFYRMEEAEAIFREVLGGSGWERYCVPILRELGYGIFPFCAVRSPSTPRAFFHRQLRHSRTSVAPWRGIPGLQEEIASLREKGLIREQEPDTFVSSTYLNRLGATQEALEEFCCQVARTVPEGTFFTLPSLQAEGFQHPLLRLPLPAWFFECLLREDTCRFTAQRLGNTHLFRRGSLPFGLDDFLTFLLDQRGGSMYLPVLRATVEQHYGWKLSVPMLTALLDISPLWLDDTRSWLFRDYQTFRIQLDQRP